MSKENNIIKLKEFIKSQEKLLFINQVNEELAILYLNILNHFSQNMGFKIIKNTSFEDDGGIDDLFGVNKIQVFTSTNQKNIEKILTTSSKLIIFTDYKNYKKFYLKFNSINGYQFEKDISFFIKNELNIDNNELIFYCITYPVLLFSETSKYLINEINYIKDQGIIEEKNHILEIRKSILEIKRNGHDIKNLYQCLKKEVVHKKLNFLTC